MLTQSRFNELCWIYLVYTQALEIRHELLTRAFIRKTGEGLFLENDFLESAFTPATLLMFYKDVYRVMRRTCRVSPKINTNGRRRHDLNGLSLSNLKRNSLAQHIVIALERRDFWWLGDPHENRIHMFCMTHNITQTESKEFFKKLTKRLRIVGHVTEDRTGTLLS